MLYLVPLESFIQKTMYDLHNKNKWCVKSIGYYSHMARFYNEFFWVHKIQHTLCPWSISYFSKTQKYGMRQWDTGTTSCRIFALFLYHGHWDLAEPGQVTVTLASDMMEEVTNLGSIILSLERAKGLQMRPSLSKSQPFKILRQV
jgi:hypothetical protein